MREKKTIKVLDFIDLTKEISLKRIHDENTSRVGVAHLIIPFINKL
jgi:hypothetical protein